MKMTVWKLLKYDSSIIVKSPVLVWRKPSINQYQWSPHWHKWESRDSREEVTQCGNYQSSDMTDIDCVYDYCWRESQWREEMTQSLWHCILVCVKSDSLVTIYCQWWLWEGREEPVTWYVTLKPYCGHYWPSAADNVA